LKAGYPQDQYDFLEAHADREIEEGLLTQYTRLQTVVATRNTIQLPDLEEGDFVGEVE